MNVKSTITAIVLSFAAITAHAETPQESPFLEAAKEAVRDLMNDPESTKFRDMNVYKGKLVCGETSGKNQMGGYAPYTQFIYSTTAKQAVILKAERGMSAQYLAEIRKLADVYLECQLSAIQDQAQEAMSKGKQIFKY